MAVAVRKSAAVSDKVDDIEMLSRRGIGGSMDL
jgi:hypothetical protein